MKNTRGGGVLYLTSNLSRISYITEMWPWILELLFKTKQKPNLFMLQGETQDCEVSLLLPCPKTCKNLWRSCVDHHSFFSSNRTVRSPKYNNSTVQSYKKLITQHLGLGNSKTERWACACIFVCTFSNCHWTKVSFFLSWCSVVQCASVWWEGWCGTRSCKGRFHQSTSRPRVCPRDRPQPPQIGMTYRFCLTSQHPLAVLSFDESLSLWQAKPSSSPRHP